MNSEVPVTRAGALLNFRELVRTRGRYGLAALGLGAALGLLASTQVDQVFSSDTQVLVTPTGLPSAGAGLSLARTETQLNLETESQIMRSQPVALKAAQLAGITAPLPDLLRAVTITVPTNSTVLTVTARDRFGVQAQRLSNAFAQAYLDNRTATAEADVATDVAALKDQLEELDKQLNKVIGPVASLPPDSPDRAYAEAQERIITAEISSTSDVINTLTSTQISGGSILSDASSPSGPALPLRPLAFGAGVLLGLIGGVMLMIYLERRDDLVRGPRDIEAVTQLPALGTAALGRRQQGAAPGLMDGWTALRHDVEAALPSRAVLLVVPVGADPGPALATVSLATSFGTSGVWVAVVCADLEASTLPELLGTGPFSRENTLSAALSRPATAKPRLTRSSGLPNVEVLPTGEFSVNSRALLSGRRFVQLVQWVREDHELVIIQALPSDAVAIARWCDGVLLVAQSGASRHDDVAAVAHQLRRLDANLLGVAVISEQLAAEARSAAESPGPVAQEAHGEADSDPDVPDQDDEQAEQAEQAEPPTAVRAVRS